MTLIEVSDEVMRAEKTIGRLHVMLCLYEFYCTNISMRDTVGELGVNLKSLISKSSDVVLWRCLQK